jgi:iron complex transport system substrate-binding protein
MVIFSKASAARTAGARHWRMLWSAGLCLLALVGLGGRGSRAAAGNVTHGCIDRFDPAVDYFPDKIAVEDAVTFRVEYHKSYKVVTVQAVYPGGPAERYVLVQCGTPAPALDDDLRGAQVVRVPITSLFSASTTHLSALVDLGRLDVLTGVSRLNELVGDAIVKRAQTGHVQEFASDSVIDAERVVAAQPSVFMTGGYSSPPSLAVIRAAGVPVVADTEWLETTALGRAEWLKYIALFLNEDGKAQQIYDAMKGRYRALSARATAPPPSSRPLVMTGRSSRGLFTIAGGQSYVAALIKDAGGRYVWADNPSTDSPSVDFEAEVRRAADADVWINGGGWRNLAAMAADEPRYAAFKAWRDGQVWVYERRMTPTGGNDYWTRSVTHPELVLADLVKIFHPTLVPDHAFEWYMRVPKR